MSVAESTNSNSGKVMAHTKSLDELQTGYMRQRVSFCQYIQILENKKFLNKTQANIDLKLNVILKFKNLREMPREST